MRIGMGYHFINRSLKIVAASAIVALLSGCLPLMTPMEVTDFSSTDVSQDPEAALRWNKAQSVISSSCVSCHSPGGSASFAPINFKNETAFITSGMVVPGNVDASKLLTRTIHYSGPSASSANRNMPPSGNFSVADYEVLEKWVSMLGIKQPPIDPYAENFTCNPEGELTASNLKKLIKLELQNTYYDLLAPLATSERNTVKTALDAIFVLMPDDQVKPFSTLSNKVSENHVKAQYDLAVKFGELIGTNSTRMTAIGGSCMALASPVESCVRMFISNFGLKAMKRTLTQNEIDAFYNFYVSRGSTQKQDLIGFFLLTPEFLYHVENQGALVAGKTNTYRRTPFELAAKISYQYLKTAPSDELLNEAKKPDSKFLTSAGIQQIIEDVIFGTQLAKTKNIFSSYFDELYGISELSTFSSTDPKFLSLVSNTTVKSPGSTHRQDMINEVQDLISYYTWDKPNGNFKELLTSDISFAKTPALATQVYGVAPWTPGQPFVRFPAGERSGLLTRAGLIINGGAENSPIATGVRITREILCNELPPPPPEAFGVMDQFPTTLLTTRERVSRITSPTNCIGCHSIINPLGFAFETYDAFGRVRQGKIQTLFNPDGTHAGTLPIDSSGFAQVQLGKEVLVQDAVQLSEEIAKSGKGEACFTRNYYRYSQRRLENNSSDGCEMQSLFQTLQAPNGGIKEMFKQMAVQPSFLMKRVDQ